MNPTKTKSQKPAPNNFLEALRDLGQGFKEEAKIQVTRMATVDVPESFGVAPRTGGTLNPNEALSLDQLQHAEQRGFEKADAAYASRLSHMREEERARLVRQEHQIKEQIKSVQEEIRLLAKSAGEFSQEVETATFQATVSPGVYHKHFFSHLKTVIASIRKKVSSSRHWLSEHNTRASKRGYYWGQVAKSGTKFMLSSERYMVTSTG